MLLLSGKGARIRTTSYHVGCDQVTWSEGLHVKQQVKHEEGRGKLARGGQACVGGWRDTCIRVGSQVLVGCRAPGGRQSVGERPRGYLWLPACCFPPTSCQWRPVATSGTLRITESPALQDAGKLWVDGL